MRRYRIVTNAAGRFKAQVRHGFFSGWSNLQRGRFPFARSVFASREEAQKLIDDFEASRARVSGPWLPVGEDTDA